MKNIYIERKAGFRRQFEIDDGKIHIKQKSIRGPEIDMNIDLSVLKPEPDTIVYKDEIIIFDIGKVGKYDKEFDEFIQLIIKKIKEIES